MNTSNYFSHNFNARNDEKLIGVRMEHGCEGYGIYFMLLEKLGESEDYMLDANFKRLAWEFHCKEEKIKAIVENYGLFKYSEDSKQFYSTSFTERMQVRDEKSEKKAQAGKVGAQRRWQNDGSAIKNDSNPIAMPYDANSSAIKNDSNPIAMPYDANSSATDFDSNKRKGNEIKENKKKSAKALKEKDDNVASLSPANAAFLDNFSSALPASAPDGDEKYGATDEIGILGEFTIFLQTFKPKGDYNKIAAQSEWCSLPPERRFILLNYLEECKSIGKKIWTSNPLFYMRYFDEHAMKELKIPYANFLERFRTTQVPGYCILKERDECNSIYFAKTAAAKCYGWEIERTL